MSTLKPPVGATDHCLGRANAPVTLVEYGDFECPHCGQAHPLLRRLVKEMGDRLQFVFRNFPLQQSHPHAYLAALAAEAAAEQNRYWEMHHLIFDNQDRLGGHFLLNLAGSLQLNLVQFGQDWKSGKSTTKVEKDFESGIRSGVNGTPTFFLNNNRMVTYDGSYESLADAIQLELEMKEN